ncbi:ABC transporter permease [Sneathiella sp. HT1-7]|uniref:ABC transporter permease n=1 Tax=Sneathiella sp. HT1-7 TaxID=2887192 RepID=UPI001D158D9C|nr:ABC transporter permease [Sneathiella sp. HT1-7]MCC3306315.1 ABC transporter permease [Sneathiella sp. HT1-7]
MNAKKKFTSTWLLWPALFMLVAFFLIPTLDILRASVYDPEFTTKHFAKLLGSNVYLDVLWRTIRLSVIVALICAVIAYPISYFIVQRPRKQQIFFLFLVFIPLWMSVLIRSYAWMVVLGREGMINALLIGLGFTDEPVKMLFTTGAVYVAMVQILLPIQIVTCYSAMTEIDLDLMRAARILGAKPWQAIRRVFLPLSLDGTVTGAIIVFMLSMGFFITPALVGGRKDIMMANLIEFQVQQLNWGFAAAISIVLLIGTVLCVIIIKRLSKILIRRLVGGGHA